MSGDTDVYQTVREKKKYAGVSTRSCHHFWYLKTYLLVWAVAGIYDEKWPVKMTHMCQLVHFRVRHVST
jgi:hypothetical protein